MIYIMLTNIGKFHCQYKTSFSDPPCIYFRLILPFYSCRMCLLQYFLDFFENTGLSGQTAVLMLTQQLPLKLVLVAYLELELEVLGVRSFFHWLTQLSMKRQVIQY